MNSWAVVCACSLSVECLYYVLCHSFLLPFSSCWFCSCSVSCGGCCCCCCCSSSHVQIANLCFASALCCVLSWMFVSSCSHTTCLSPLLKWLWYQHWLAFALPHHVPPTPLHLIPSPLTIMTGCCGDDFPAVLRSSFLHFLLAWLVAPCLAHVLYHLVTALPCAVCGWLCCGEWCSSPKFGLLANRYHYCEKCFNEIQGETVSLGDDPTQPQTWVLVNKMWFLNLNVTFQHARCFLMLSS